MIRLLGPLSIESRDGAPRVPASKQRSLLAMLAVQAPDVVSVDKLAEAIWGGAPPASWQVTLRNYVKRLRNGLGPDVAARIVTSTAGYLLHISPDEVDVLLFESLAKAGLASASAGDWRQASVRLCEAIALWRGTPFADIESRLVHDQQVHHLNELRLAVLEARIESDIHLSRSAAVIPDLWRLTDQHPTRERFRVLLMLALYRSGRRADALDVYKKTRDYTIEEFGLEPGEEIRDLQQRILRTDPGLLTETGPPRQVLPNHR